MVAFQLEMVGLIHVSTFVPSQKATMEKEMATHSSTLTWKISWTEEPDSLPSMGSQRVGHN